jgi:RsiW-degrading membrane proteinase PrsW (M82 family)
MKGFNNMGYLVILVISICFAGLLYFMASKRGANKSFWAIMGFFFGPFAIPFLFFGKKVDPTNTI